MHLDPQGILLELQRLRTGDHVSALRHLRELEDAAKTAAPTKRHSQRNLAAALTVESINYSCVGIERLENSAEIKRRFTIAVQRAQAWVATSEKEGMHRRLGQARRDPRVQLDTNDPK